MIVTHIKSPTTLVDRLRPAVLRQMLLGLDAETERVVLIAVMDTVYEIANQQHAVAIRNTLDSLTMESAP